MTSFIKNWPRFFTYAAILLFVFTLAMIWVFGLQPLISDSPAQDETDKGLKVLYTSLLLVTSLFIPLLISYSPTARQQIEKDFIRPIKNNKRIEEDILHEAIDIVPAGIVMYDSNDQLILCNAMFKKMWSYSDSDLPAGVTHQQLGMLDRQRGVKVAGGVAEEYLESRLKYRAEFSEEQVVELPDGRLISTKDRPLARGGFISVQTDITDLVDARNRFHKSEQQLLDAIEGLDEGFISFDKNDRLVIANTTHRTMYPAHEAVTSGISFEELIRLFVFAGELPSAIGCEDEWIARRMNQHNSHKSVDEQHLSSGRWVKVSERRTENGGIVIISSDISEAKKNQTILERYATTDEMTGIMNRRTGLAMLSKLMAQFQRSDDELTIAYIDIDKLKLVNDNFGHDNGDLMIKIISNVAKEATSDDDLIMRLGGDEFLIAFPNCSVELANKKMQEIKHQLGKISEREKYQFELSFSFGTSVYSPRIFNDVDVYVAHADKRMYKNKIKKQAVG